MARAARKGKQAELFGREIEAAQARQALLARLDAEGDEERADRLRACGVTFPLWCGACGHRHDVATKCSRKWCPSCAPKRANQRAARLRHAIKLMRWPMHITLTVPNIADEEITRTMLRDLLTSFRRLRNMKLWRQNVTGGVYGMEVTNKGEGWHPHIHIVADCRWLALRTPQPHHDDDAAQIKAKCRCAAQELQSAWAAATRLEMHKSIWIRRCDSNAAAEIVKYAIKAQDLIECRGSASAMCAALDSCRLTSPFGSMRGLELDDAQDYKLTCPAGHREWSIQKPAIAVEIEIRQASAAAKRNREAKAATNRADAIAFVRRIAEQDRKRLAETQILGVGTSGLTVNQNRETVPH